MGVSTVASYTGAQIFEARRPVPGRSSTGTSPAPPPSSAASASTRSPRRSRAGTRTAYPRDGIAARAPRARDRRRVPVAPRGRAAPVRPRDGLPAAALHPHRPLRHLQAVHRAGRRAVRAADDAARAVPASRTPSTGAADPDRRGRAGLRDRQAVLHRRDVLRLDQPGGARDPRDRDEPARRQVQHRRGRRGRRPAATTPSGAARSSRSRPAASA